MNFRSWWRRRMLNNSRRARFNKTKILAAVSLITFLGILSLTLFLTALFAFYAKDLPRPDRVVRREGFATKIFDRNGEPLYDVFADQKRIPITIEQIPEYLKNATIAVEDKNFYKHSGFDLRGILRSVYNIVVHHSLQGGSTLTQQLVKNVLLTMQRTLPRKIKEFILAVQIEHKYSKDQILQMYLNESPYGGTSWGVESAAEAYFGKKASELNLIESAIIAGLPQRPSYYSPFGDNPKAYVSRTKHVLQRMKDDGYITKEQQQQALVELDRVQFASAGVQIKAAHFVMYVKNQLEERYGQSTVEQGGLRVYTSLDLKIQEVAQQAVTEEIKKVETLHITNGASLVMDPNTGEILAMVGSKDYNDPDYDGKVNVTLSLRQPGSAIKPVTYVTAFAKGYTPATMIVDTQTVFPVVSQPDYKPENYDGKFHGPMQLRFALGNSINLPAVKLLAHIGLKEMLKTAFEMGITTLEPTVENLRRLGLSVTLGGGEVKLIDLVSAYSAFANGGLRVEPVSILKITDRDGKVIDEHRFIEGRRVLSAEQAFLISDILSDNNARLITFGERNALVIPGRKVAVKTGTTNDKRDNWTLGWTPQVVVGVWVGNNDNTAIKKLASGVSGAAPIWRRIIISVLNDKPNLSFSVPSGIVNAQVDNVSGYREHDGFPSRTEYFIAGTEPIGEDPIHVKLKLCPGQNKLATPTQVARGEYEEKEYFIFKESDLVSTDGINRWQQGIDEWISGQSDPRYRPPSDYCGIEEEISVVILEPRNQEQINSGEIKVRVDVITNNKVEEVEFFVNGESRDKVSSKPFEKIFTLEDGAYTLKVKAKDEKGNSAEAEIKIGVNVPWDWAGPTLTPSPIPLFIPTPTLTPIPTLTPLPTSS